ncbi:MAG: right-handed parallel beta-helix repeat-containing protein [Gemmataceae bacterium]|nr:right-handed parallel beta-helix repeat-containing protein [Gemmataceae bacterium]
MKCHATSRHLPAKRRRLWVRPLEDRTVPAAFLVNDFGDLGNGTGNNGDLRYVLTQLNASPDPTNTVSFIGNGTITLTSQLPTVTVGFSMTGNGATNTVINANKTGRLITVDSTAPVTISGMTLTNGSLTTSGGGIRMGLAGSSLTVTDCIISNNFGGTGAGGSGGGIYMAGNSSLTMTNTTVSGNTGRRGGGVYFFDSGSLVVNNSSITGNTQTGSTNGGGGIYFYGYINAGGFSIRNSTISGNFASSVGAGIQFRGLVGTVEIQNSTITNNSAGGTGGGGGMNFSAASAVAPLNLVSSIVAQNANNTNSFPDIVHAGTTNATNSFIGTSAGMTTLVNTNSTVGTLATPANAKLGVLSNNGGPTFTHLPLSGSPVRNKGSNPSALTLDQRGLPRVLDGNIDIGSVESSDPTPIPTLNLFGPVTAPGATPNVVQVTYVGSNGVQAASIDINDITVTDPVGKPVAVTAASSVPTAGGVIASYTITPPGGAWDAQDSGNYTVALVANQVFDSSGANAAPAGSIGTFAISITTTFVVNATNDEVVDTDGLMSLREAIARSNGYGSPDTITFDPTVFATQKTISNVNGEYVVADAVTITGPANRVVLDAKQTGRVMTIAAPNIGNLVAISNINFTNGKITGTGNRGGGIFIEDESVTLTNVTVSNNTSDGTGGGIYIRGNTFPTNPGSLTIVDSVVQNNASIGDPALGFRIGSGGGISIDLAGKLVMQRTTVSGNTARGQGGGVYFVTSGTLDMQSSLLTGNRASGTLGGGGLYFYGTVVGSAKITNTTISGNTATAGPGGGIALQDFNTPGSVLEVFNSTITNNSAVDGGGISRSGGTSLTPLSMTSTIVAKNTASSGTGPDLFLNGDVITSVNSLIGVEDSGGFFQSVNSKNNLVGTAATPLDPLLGPLANNGGPTLTHALLTGSAAIDTGVNTTVPLTSDQRGSPYVRLFDQVGVPQGTESDGTDMGAFELQPNPTPPSIVTSVGINGGNAQRSRVTTLQVNFDSKVTIPTPNAAFTLTRVSDSASVTLNAVLDVSGLFVTITFTGGAVDGAPGNLSLQDGRYTLTAVPAQFTGAGLNGNAGVLVNNNFNSTPYVGPLTPATGIFRIFGDASGNGKVESDDFLAFRLAFLSTSDTFDFNGNGSVDSSTDLLQFRLNFLKQVV